MQARSTVHRMRAGGLVIEVRDREKRGRTTEIKDEELAAENREVLRKSDFPGKGHPMVGARLTRKGSVGAGALCWH